MARISHFYAEPEAQHDADFPPPLVVCVRELSQTSIEEVLDFLCANIALRVDTPPFNFLLAARPIEIQVGKQALRISERCYWYLLNEALGGRSDGVRRYLDAVDHYIGAEELPHCTCMDVVGGIGIYVYLDRYLPEARMVGKDKVPGLNGAIDAFQLFLERCDIDHEPWHFPYVQQLLDHLRVHGSERQRYMKLFLFYLQTQWGNDILSFDLLRPDGVLRSVVNHYVSGGAVDPLDLRADVLFLCAHVYGSDLGLADDVLDYCRSKGALTENRGIGDYRKREIDRVRARQDLRLRDCKYTFDTGFHVYRDGKWSNVQ